MGKGKNRKTQLDAEQTIGILSNKTGNLETHSLSAVIAGVNGARADDAVFVGESYGFSLNFRECYEMLWKETARSVKQLLPNTNWYQLNELYPTNAELLRRITEFEKEIGFDNIY